MTFRDDKEAAYAQLEAAKKDAEDQRQEHERQEQALRDQVGKLKKKLKARDQQDPHKRARKVMIFSISLLVTGGVVMGYFMTSGGRDSARDRTSARRVKVKPLEQLFKKMPTDPLEQAEYLAERAHPKSERAGLMTLIAGAYLRKQDTRRARELLARSELVLAAVAETATSTRDLTFRAEALETMACVHRRLGQKKEAAARRARAKKIHGAVISYAVEMRVASLAARRCHLIGDVERSRALLAQAVQAASKLNNAYSRRRELQQLADQAQELGDKKTLSAISASLQDQMPSHARRSPDTLTPLAELAWRAGDTETAKEFLVQITARPAHTSRRIASVGRLLAVMGKQTEARAWLQRALEKARGDNYFQDPTRVAIILGYAALGEREKARSMCLTGKHFLALARAHLGAGRDAEALSLISHIPTTNPDLSICLALARAGRTAEALALANKRSGNSRKAESIASVVASQGKRAEKPAQGSK